MQSRNHTSASIPPAVFSQSFHRPVAFACPALELLAPACRTAAELQRVKSTALRRFTCALCRSMDRRHRKRLPLSDVTFGTWPALCKSHPLLLLHASENYCSMATVHFCSFRLPAVFSSEGM
eukprot:IDg14387t1